MAADHSRASKVIWASLRRTMTSGIFRPSSTYLFLRLNEWELMSSEAEVVAAVMALAEEEMDEVDFSGWLKNNSVPRPAHE
jgi:hypothetical protein